jgi:hypothetical protein
MIFDLDQGAPHAATGARISRLPNAAQVKRLFDEKEAGLRPSSLETRHKLRCGGENKGASTI